MQLEFASTTMPTIMIWGLGLLVFLVGGLIGYFNTSLDAKKQNNDHEQKINAIRIEAEYKISEANRKAEEAKAQAAAQPQVVTVKEASLLRLSRGTDARLQIELDDQPINTPLSPERRKRLIEMLNLIRPLLENGMPPQAQAGSKPMSGAPLSTPKAIPVPPTAATVKPVPAVISLSPIKPKPVDPETEFKLLSMVKQIDAVLKMRMAGTPLESMGISLQDTPQGGLEVQIGTQIFETIDDVPNADVKAAIRAAIAEWENKYTPGA